MQNSESFIFFSQVNKRAVLRGEYGPQNTFLKLERWQGPPHINKEKQNEIVFVYFVCLDIKPLSDSMR